VPLVRYHMVMRTRYQSIDESGRHEARRSLALLERFATSPKIAASILTDASVATLTRAEKNPTQRCAGQRDNPDVVAQFRQCQPRRERIAEIDRHHRLRLLVVVGREHHVPRETGSQTSLFESRTCRLNFFQGDPLLVGELRPRRRTRFGTTTNFGSRVDYTPTSTTPNRCSAGSRRRTRSGTSTRSAGGRWWWR
jgi:hypothetical protein